MLNEDKEVVARYVTKLNSLMHTIPNTESLEVKLLLYERIKQEVMEVESIIKSYKKEKKRKE